MKLLKRIRKIDPDNFEDGSAMKAFEILRDWDGKLSADSVGAVIYSACNDEIALNLLERCYGVDRDEFEKNPDLNAVDHLRRQLKPAFFNALERGSGEEYMRKGESVDSFLIASLTSAAISLKQRYGAVDAVTWSDVHVTKQIHPLASSISRGRRCS